MRYLDVLILVQVKLVNFYGITVVLISVLKAIRTLKIIILVASSLEALLMKMMK